LSSSDINWKAVPQPRASNSKASVPSVL